MESWDRGAFIDGYARLARSALHWVDNGWWEGLAAMRDRAGESAQMEVLASLALLQACSIRPPDAACIYCDERLATRSPSQLMAAYRFRALLNRRDEVRRWISREQRMQLEQWASRSAVVLLSSAQDARHMGAWNWNCVHEPLDSMHALGLAWEGWNLLAVDYKDEPTSVLDLHRLAFNPRLAAPTWLHDVKADNDGYARVAFNEWLTQTEAIC